MRTDPHEQTSVSFCFLSRASCAPRWLGLELQLSVLSKMIIRPSEVCHHATAARAQLSLMPPGAASGGIGIGRPNSDGKGTGGAQPSRTGMGFVRYYCAAAPGGGRFSNSAYEYWSPSCEYWSLILWPWLVEPRTQKNKVSAHYRRRP